jgi:glycosyltransferase involved in cell wall biosynthesis
MTEPQPGSPMVSVIVPTYRRPELLKRAAASVLAQTFEDFEVIVVDDASDDATGRVVETLDDARVRYLRHDENRGLAAARNTGFRASRGAYIAFLDDDDELLPGYVETMCHRLESAPDDVAFVACGVRETDERGGGRVPRDVIPPPYAYATKEASYRDLLRRVPFSGWFLMIRTSALRDTGGFDESMRTEQDRDLLYRLVQRYAYTVVPDVLAIHHFHDGAHLNVYGPRKAAAFRSLLAKHEEALLTDRTLWSSWHYKLGWLHYVAGEPARGRRYLLAGLRRRPMHPKSWWALLSYELLGSNAPKVHATVSRAAKRVRRR